MTEITPRAQIVSSIIFLVVSMDDRNCPGALIVSRLKFLVVSMDDINYPGY